MAARPDLAAIGVIKHLRLVRRHVDPGWAVARASLARQTKIKSLMDLRRLPAALNHLAVDHLLKYAGASTGGVFLLPGGLIGRTHHTQPACGIRQALAHARAAVHSLGEVVETTQSRRTQIGVDRTRVDRNTRVQQVLRVEGGLDLTEY